MPKKVNFGDFLKTWNLWSNSVTKQVSCYRVKIVGFSNISGDFQSNATFSYLKTASLHLHYLNFKVLWDDFRRIMMQGVPINFSTLFLFPGPPIVLHFYLDKCLMSKENSSTAFLLHYHPFKITRRRWSEMERIKHCFTLARSQVIIYAFWS